MAAERAASRQFFDVMERGIGAPLEQYLDSRQYRAFLTASGKARRSVTHKVEETMAANLHLFGAPAITDVRALSRSLVRCERRVHELALLLPAYSGHLGLVADEHQRSRPRVC